MIQLFNFKFDSTLLVSQMFFSLPMLLLWLEGGRSSSVPNEFYHQPSSRIDCGILAPGEIACSAHPKCSYDAQNSPNCYFRFLGKY